MVRLFIFIVFTSLSINSVFGQMNKWIIQNNVINPEDGSSSLVQGNIAPTDYAENAIFFENGDLALFIKDGNIYNEEGNLIATLLSDANLNCPINNQNNKDIGMGYSESLIVQVPGSGCNEFYIITSFSRFDGIKIIEDWSSVSMQKNALIYIKVKYDGNKKWHVVPDIDNCTLAKYIIQEGTCGTFNLPNVYTSCYYEQLLNLSQGTQNGTQDANGNGNVPSPSHKYGRSTMLEASKIQANGKRYLFVCNYGFSFNIYEINENEIQFLKCEPLATQSYIQIYGHRAEMELFQESSEKIMVAFPVVYRKIEVNAPLPFTSSAGVRFLDFNLTGNDIVKGGDNYVEIINLGPNPNTIDILPVIKGIEFSKNNNFLYYSMISLKRNNIDPILKIFTYDISYRDCIGYLERDFSQPWLGLNYSFKKGGILASNSIAPNTFLWTPNIISGISTINQVENMFSPCNVDYNVVINEPYEFAHSHIEKTKNGSILWSSKSKLWGLPNGENPTDPTRISFLYPNNSQNRLTANTNKKLYNTEFNDNGDIKFPFTPFTYLLPDQIDGEDYTNWIKPVPDIYPEEIIVAPNTSFATDFTYTPHSIEFYEGNIDGLANNIFPGNFVSSLLSFNPPGYSTPPYTKWPLNPTNLNSTYPSVLAKVTHLPLSNNSSCPGIEYIKIFDLRHSIYSNFDYSSTLISSGVSTTTTAGNQYNIDWDITSNRYKIPLNFRNCITQTINLYLIDPPSQTRLSLVHTYSFPSYSETYEIQSIGPGLYELEYQIGFCGSSLLNTNSTSKFVLNP